MCWTVLCAAMLPVVPTVREWTPAGGVCTNVDAFTVSISADAPVDGPEGYRLEIAADGVRAIATGEAGIRHARTTWAQLTHATGGKIPTGVVDDSPKYRVRGVMLDVARKYYPLEFLDRLVDTMAYFKFNEFHIHLNDCGPGTNWAFRIECEAFPGLTSPVGFYTKRAFRDFVKRAAARGVDVVPEIDAPAHSRAFTRYRPDFRLSEKDDVHLNLKNPDVYPFFDRLYAEYLGGDDPVFAGPNFSIGTDEYPVAEAESFRLFMDTMFKNVRRHGKNPRSWGSLEDMPGKTPVDATGVTLDLWCNPYFNPRIALKEGYHIISMPDQLLYIVPNFFCYNDYLNCERIFKTWEPCWVAEFYAAPDNPLLMGGKFALWNEQGEKGVDIEGTFDRLFPGFLTVGQKMWSGEVDGLGWEEFKALTSRVHDRPTLDFGEKQRTRRFYDSSTGRLGVRPIR